MINKKRISKYAFFQFFNYLLDLYALNLDFFLFAVAFCKIPFETAESINEKVSLRSSLAFFSPLSTADLYFLTYVAILDLYALFSKVCLSMTSMRFFADLIFAI